MLAQGEAKKLEQALQQKPIPFEELMVSASDEDALLFGAGPKLWEAKKDSFETCKAKNKHKKYVKLHNKLWSALGGKTLERRCGFIPRDTSPN